MSRHALDILGLTILGGGLIFGQNANSPYVLKTFAGSFPLGDGGPATQALLSAPRAVVTDNSGNVYVLDPGNYRIRKFTPGGAISTVVQLGVAVNDMKLGKDGNFYLTASGLVYKLSPTGTVTVLAGNGTPGFSGDGGPAAQAQVGVAQGIVLDSAGNIYFAEPSRIREITLDGNIHTVAGTATAGYNGDNQAATSAQLSYPTGLGIDSSNNLYIADNENYRIRKVSNGVITTFAGSGVGDHPINGPATASPIGIPGAVTADGSGNVFVSDLSFSEIYKIGTDGNLTQVAGTPTFAYSDGPATSTYVISPQGLAPDGSGGLYIAETGGNRVRQLSGGNVLTIAGRLHYAGDGGTATSALFGTVLDTVADAQGNVYILDSSNYRIRKVAPNGTISTFAGNGLPGNPTDGATAASAALPQMISMTIDGQGNFYLGTFQKIYKINAAGVISTFAGDPSAATGSGDGGPATKAQLNVATGLAADSVGNIYVGDCCNSRVRKISPSGIITAFAGTAGTPGYSGDGGLATSARLAGPGILTADAAGNVYIGDSGNNAVRMVTPGGIISTVAGNGTAGSPADGAPAKSPLTAAAGLTVDGAGNLYIMSTNYSIYRVNTAGIIHVVSGSGTAPVADGVLANTTTGFNGKGIKVDSNGDLLVADPSGNVIRKLVFDAPSGVAIADGNNQTGTVGTTLPKPLKVTVNGRGGVPVPGATVIFAVTSGDATLSAHSSLTDSTGTAGIGVTFGSTPGSVNIAVAVAGTGFGTQFTLTSTAVNSNGGAPAITLVANAFGDAPLIAPNMWVEIKGSNLAPASDSRIWLGPDFVNNQLPTQLDGVSVTVNGKPAYVYFISPAQVNILTPPDALPSSVQVQVTVGGVQSNITTVSAQPQSLSFFEFVSSAGLHYVYGRHANDNSLIGPPGLFPSAPSITTPVKPGETIYVAGTGFGPTDVQVVSGALTQSGNLPLPFPVVKIGGIQASVTFAGLIAVGTYQINLVVPSNVPDGDLPLTATYDGLNIQSNLLITVQH
jgi:uncharacterized protein (TIGR03437 family)